MNSAIISDTQAEDQVIGNIQTSKSMATLRYFNEGIPARVASSKRLYNEMYQEQIYGLKMSENEKTRKIVAMVNSQKLERAKERKKEKKLIKMKLENQKKKLAQINSRKHMEGKWRAQMMKLSVELKKGRIQDGHWRRHEWERENSGDIKKLKKKRIQKNKILAEEIKYRKRVMSAAREAMKKGKDPEKAANEIEEKLKPKEKKKKKRMNSESLAILAPFRIKGRKVYTEDELKELNDKTSMKFFKKTNKHGITKNQENEIIEKQEEKRPKEIIVQSEVIGYQRHILRKKIIKKYKKEKKGPEENNIEGEGEEEEIEENSEADENKEEESEAEKEESKEENEKEEVTKVEQEIEDDGKYKPMYPNYKENHGVENIEVHSDEKENQEENKEGEDKEDQNENEANGDNY